MKISVVVPAYNAENYLNRCLDSIMGQSYSDWEVIAIDDGSQDHTFSILLNYAIRDNRFIVSSHTNQGAGYTRNAAIEQASGDYIVFLDADDYIDMRYFEEIVAYAEKEQSDVVFVDVIQEKPNGNLIKLERSSVYKNDAKERIIRHQLTGKLPWGGCRKAVRAALLSENDIRYSNDIVGEEALFSLKVLHYAKKISFIEKLCYHYVNYPNTQSTKGDVDPWGDVCIKCRDWLRENGLYEEFKTTINSFALTAMIISIYRISQKHNVEEAYAKSTCVMQKFILNYDYDFDLDSLEIRIKLIIPFAKLKMVFPIIVASKIKDALVKIRNISVM